MNDAISYNSGDWFYPRQTQDSEILQQLGFIPGLKDFLMLRQVHALEHATVWVLSSLDQRKNPTKDNETIGGLSTEKGFFLYGEIDPLKLRQAVRIALNRLKQGDWDLALHPRCGTNSSVSMALTTGMVVTTHLLLPREPIGQLFGVGLAAMTATCIAPEIGMSVQKYITTAIPFNLKIEEIAQTVDTWGRSAHFVGLQWQNLQ